MADLSTLGIAPILVMGVCGTGKTTIARRTAQAMGAAFLDADDFHPPENVARMAAGLPLDDSMRWQWLDRVAEAVAETTRREGAQVVLACSALKRTYRDRLRARLGPIHVAHLSGPPALIAERMTARPGHFMPVGLLDSQLADLEPPGQEEDALICDISRPPEALCAQIRAKWGPALQE
ncbi:gluconokinase [Thioclava atlantica]|nr:gluconokinase [Thioclava atlantica]